MTRAAAAAHEAAFWDVPPEPVADLMATTSAQHLQYRPKFKDSLRDHPWHTVKGVATAKGTLVALAGVAAAVAFVIVAIAAFAGGGTSDDVTLNGNPGGGDKTRDFEGDKTRDGTTSTVADTATAPSSSTTEATTTTTEDPADDDGDGQGDDDGDDPPAVPPTAPSTQPPPPETTTTTAPATTTTARPVAQPAIDSFDVELDSWCNRTSGTVEATFRWTSRNGSSATLTSSSPGQPPVTVDLTEDDYDVCPRPGDRWTLRVTGPSGTTPATRTITVPALPVG
jgi:hypothetical protein